MNLATIGLGLAINMVAIMVLAYGIYFRRHGKADVTLAYIALNVGVFAAVTLLAGSSVDMGFAFGLFGILSIIRLRSTQLSQSEVAYFFVALVLGLIHSLGATQPILVAGFDVLLLGVLFMFDRHGMTHQVTEQKIVLDRAIANVEHIREEVEFRLGAPVERIDVVEVDYVREMTEVVAHVHENQTLQTSTQAEGVLR